MTLSLRNLSYIRQSDPRLADALEDLQHYINQGFQQVNADPTGVEVSAPPQVSSLSVQAAHGIFDISINDNNSSVQRGINYFVEYSTSPNFPTGNTFVVDLGASRNHRANWGNQTLYFRAYSCYPTSAPGTKVIFGGANPLPVVGGGSLSGPTPLTSNGSGTSNGSDPADGGFGRQPKRVSQQ